MPAWLEAGIKVVPVVASVGVAKLVEKRGAAAVIAEGGESGGHIGELTPMALVPQICDAVKIPVIAAGGMQMAVNWQQHSCWALWVQVGTRFLVAKECTISPVYKERFSKQRILIRSVPAAVWGTRCAL